MPLIFMCFPAPYTRAASHTQAAPSMSTILTHPRDFPRVLAPFSHTFPRLPHTVTKLQKPSSNFNETSVSGPANPQPRGHGHGMRKPTRRDQRPVHSKLRIQPAYSDSTVQRLGGMDDDDAGVAATSTTGGGAAPVCMIGPSGLKARLQSSPKASPLQAGL